MWQGRWLGFWLACLLAAVPAAGQDGPPEQKLTEAELKRLTDLWQGVLTDSAESLTTIDGSEQTLRNSESTLATSEQELAETKTELERAFKSLADSEARVGQIEVLAWALGGACAILATLLAIDLANR